MGTPINIHEAKAGLSGLVARAERGEEIIIARRGVAVARLVPLKREVGDALDEFDRLRALDRGGQRPLEDFDDAIEAGRP